MSAHYGDKCALCGKNDFLPLKCDLCALLLCTEHMAPFAHPCAGREDNVSVARPEAVGLGKALADEMAQVARRFEGKGEWSQKVHIRVKGSGAALASSFQKENKFLKAYREKAKEGKSSSKSQRMSEKVRRMLMKGKAGGRNSLHQDDRFYLEVRFGGLTVGEDDPSSSSSSSLPSSSSSSSSSPPSLEVVDYLFFSRLWTLGRTLDEVVGKHQAALRKVYPPSSSEDSSSPSYSFLNERTGLSLHSFLGRSLLDLASTEIVNDCDTLILLPFTEGGEEEEEGGKEGGKEGGEDTVVEGREEGEKGEAAAATEAEAPAAEPMDTEAGEGQIEEGEAPLPPSLPPSLTLHITQGSSVSHPLVFPLSEWPSLCISDLQARVYSATGIRPERQKLLFKGVMEGEGKLLCEWKGLKDGSKITLMTKK